MTSEKTTERDWVAEVGGPAYESIRDMVAALECDYDRLEELKDERDALLCDTESEDDAERDTAIEALADWDEENAEELKDLTDAAGDYADQEDARQRIQEDALSLRIFGERIDGEWQADRYELLLTTGGPAVRIVGDLDEHGEATSARLEVQDWFKPWTQYCPIAVSEDTLLAYAREFCMGE